MKTILHVITGLGSGGAERQLTALARGSDPRRFRLVVVSLTGAGVYGEELRQAGIALHCLNLGRGHLSPTALWSLVRLMRETRPDLVQTWLYHADLAGLLAAGLAGRPPVLWTLRCSDMDLNRYRRLTRWVLALLGRLSPYPVAIVANSAAGLAAHRQLGYRPRRSQVIPNGIDTAAFQPDLAARTALRSEWGVGAEERLVVCCARHDPMKDHAGLLAAFAGLRHPARLLLVGKGTEAANAVLSAEIAAAGLTPDRVIRLGERRDIPRILAAADLFVLGSAFGEGFPNAVAEAMACELPGAVTDVGDASAIVGETGTVAPPGQPAALTAALDQLLTLEPAERRRLGTAARQRVLTHYGLSAMIAAYQDLYGALAR